MNTVINKISTTTYQKINFQSRNNQQKTEQNNNSTRNILVSSLIALASLSVPTVEANTLTNIDKIEIISNNNDIKDETATKMKLSSTANGNVYFDKKNNM